VVVVLLARVGRDAGLTAMAEDALPYLRDASMAGGFVD
jgi:hypothetical protein